MGKPCMKCGLVSTYSSLDGGLKTKVEGVVVVVSVSHTPDNTHCRYRSYGMFVQKVQTVVLTFIFSGY